MINAFGQWLRKFRIDKGLLLGDMARTLEISSAFLSAIETGRKNIPDGIVSKIRDSYRLSEEEYFSLLEAVQMSQQKISLDLSGETTDTRRVALEFAKRFHSLTPNDRGEILKILSKAGDDNCTIKE